MIGGIGGGGAPVVVVYYRKGSPVEYVTGEESMKTEVLKDGKVEADGTGSIKNWGIAGVEKGTRYYFQFINTAAAAGVITNIKVASADVKRKCQMKIQTARLLMKRSQWKTIFFLMKNRIRRKTSLQDVH